MAKDLYVPVTLRGNRLDCKASLGQTVIVTEGPETYTGPVTVAPSESEQVLQTKDKLLTDNVTVGAIPVEEWDGILYPFDEDGRFNCKYLYLDAGDSVICEWKGIQRQWSFEKSSGIYKSANRGNNGLVMNHQLKNADNQLVYPHMRCEFEPVAGPCILILAGYGGAPDGTHSANDGYVFFGEYFKYKVIRAE